MSFFVWEHKYSVGSEQIDQQHKQLFEMAGDLNAAMSEGRGNEALIGLFARLVAYMRHHFTTEEGLMRDHLYPGYLQHKMEHEKFTGQLLDLQRRIVEGRATISVDTMQFLSVWLSNHFQGPDAKAGEHIRKKSPTLAGAIR